MTSYKIPEATGASVRPEDLYKKELFPITDFGAAHDASPMKNTHAINSAILAASRQGGTVVFPCGTFYVYTIRLASNVNLCLKEGAVIAAAKTDIEHSYEKQTGEGGNYDEPETNPYAGIQDHGHSYFANSLIYGADLENIMIYGPGLFTGGRLDEESGVLEYVLQGGDPPEPEDREQRGHKGEWFGNKGLALVRCRNVIFKDFSVTIGGHFAIIAEGCDNLYVEHILVDTTRDAFDIDCCRDVTVRHTVCNSLTDDGLCLKASFGAGVFRPLTNVLLEDCVVSGYDAGSVYAGEYTRDKLAAVDRCGPTGRVKFGTESTCGYHLVTIRRVRFDRSRGFCLEAVDCSSLTDVIFEDCTMNNVSSSPIFLRAGDRGRFPVTGSAVTTEYPASGETIRLDNKNWILPNHEKYHCYPAKRYSPHYNRTKTVTVDGCSYFEIIDEENPAQRNPACYEERDGRFYLRTWQPNKAGERLATNALSPDSCPESGALADNEPFRPYSAGSYETDFSKEIPEKDLPLYANGIGSDKMASVANILIRNVTVTNADPRYPILLMGLTDSHIKNIVLENISVEYRGGLSMEHAVEQRQLNTEWRYSQFHAKEHVQNIPWLVNSFFLKNEGLLPRADWNQEKDCWQDDPYNVPELPEVYPEPCNWGILPAYGLFAKHVDGLTLKNIRFSCKVPDHRHVCVFDDADGITIDGMEAYCRAGMAPIAAVTHHYRRHTNAENVLEQPYFTTTVTALDIRQPLRMHESTSCTINKHAEADSSENKAAENSVPRNRALCNITDTPKPGKAEASYTAEVAVNAPAPGTPRDSLYPYPTVPCRETGYTYPVDTEDYPLPLTVHRPFIRPAAPVRIAPGYAFCLTLTLRNPASDVSQEADSGMIYNEQAARKNHSVQGKKIPLTLSCGNLPDGADFDEKRGIFTWTPSEAQTGEYHIHFTVDDGILPESMELKICVDGDIK